MSTLPLSGLGQLFILQLTAAEWSPSLERLLRRKLGCPAVAVASLPELARAGATVDPRAVQQLADELKEWLKDSDD
ncbi:MAG: hypothetical protein MUP80_06260 [Acidobacteriia bacterium]|nr:hypothetical protein [Terriglobia bacterium]